MNETPHTWEELAHRDELGLCPASPGYNEPHIFTREPRCDECGARK